MANRRFSGGGGPRGGLNRSFVNPPSNISPWQGGATPGGNSNNNIQNQLALALTSLIQQTTHQQNDGPPSLLNMNTSPGFYNQDQFGNQNRFGNRGRQDFRRSEPYNKNRGGAWRNDSNVRANRGQNNFSKNRSNFRDRNQPNKDKSKNDKKANIKTPNKEKSTDNKVEDSEKDIKPVIKTEPDSADEIKKEEGGQKKTPKPTKYDGLPNGLLHCFVCNKSMWDGESFQNHLGGKAHKQMINSLEESFQITVNILRENMRLCEERKMIEFERMQRSRRYHHNNVQEQDSHCNMCDLKFMGKIVVHRQTEGHQRLKRFLHPKCKRCNLEFPSRMEWVDHQFLPEHLFKLKEYLDNRKLDQGEFKVKIQAEVDNDPLLEENVQNEDESPVLEMDEDLNNLFNRIPVFKRERAVAKNNVKAANGFICELCKIFMPSEEESQTHLKSFHHYQTFVEAVKIKFQKNQKNSTDKKRKAEGEAGEEGEGEGEENEEKETTKDDEEMNSLLNDMYDPFVADGDDSKDDATEENGKEEDNENDETEKEEKEDEEKPVVEEEEKKVEEQKTPATPNTRAKRGQVKNNAGPKSKKARN